MDLNHIEDSETLYRAVLKTNPDGFINGKPTAALFMDAKGCSVERDGDRPEKIIMQRIKQRFSKYKEDYNTAVKVTAGECRKVGTCPKPENNKKNKYHAEIHDSTDVILIPIVKAAQLAAICKIVKQLDEN